jgi:predicted 3-demethylubiquinone-9 3-methyltransferase (glyoxalase superfamily)
MQNITTFLTFKTGGAEAVKFYANIFKDSKIDHIMTMPESEQLLHAGFSLNGQEFMAMDGGDYEGFKFSEGMSLFVSCADQEEVDYYWQALTAGGGEAGQCGWLKDKFGVSWQVIPLKLGELMGDPDPEKSARVMQAMLKMKKIIVSDLQLAYDSKDK